MKERKKKERMKKSQRVKMEYWNVKGTRVKLKEE